MGSGVRGQGSGHSLAECIATAVKQLNIARIDNPGLDARLLFCHALGLDRAQLLSQSERILNDAEISMVDALIARREKREPVARIIGRREFWGLDFGLNEATLEPRPDSETVIEAVAAEFQARRGETLRVLDLGAGTGCLLLSALHEFPQATGLGIDIAPRAVEQAEQNALALGLASRAIFRLGHWFSTIDETFDIIISNPPYIPAADIESLMPEVRDFDPLRALDGGEDGLDPYRAVITRVQKFLNPKGVIFFECGDGQARDIAMLLRENGFAAIVTKNDLSGIARCIYAIKNP